MIPSGATIEVIGWVMLAKLDAGRYRVEHSDYYGRLAYTFFKPKGRIPVCRHYAKDVDLWVSNGNSADNNRIEIIK